jgi:hypothetical protein
MLNLYCDESCHILNDHSGVMTLGAVIAPSDARRRISRKLRDLKAEHNCRGELKWTKVSKKNLPFYLSILGMFFDETDLSFRALIVREKDRLDHDRYNDGDHDSFYFKIYYYLVRNVVEYRRGHTVQVYLDIKDTKSSLKVRKLQEVLANSFHDFDHALITKTQQVRSHESELMQLCDFLLGAVTYANRGLNSSDAKTRIVHAFESYAGHKLTTSTSPWELKLNLFPFVPRED